MTTTTTTTTTVEDWSSSSPKQQQQRSPTTRTSKQNTVPQPHHDDTSSKVTPVPQDTPSSTANYSQSAPAAPPSPPPCKLQLDGRRRWALTLCAHCRDYASLTCVLTCYSKVAHHREVKLVTDEGVRESLGVLSEKQLVFEDQGDGDAAAAAAAAVLPPTTGELGRIVRLNQDAVDRGILCTVSCEQCAGQPLGQCIDAGHQQQVKRVDARHTKFAHLQFLRHTRKYCRTD